MKYSELLTQYIETSGLSLSEIAKRMDEEKGIKIDRSYISMLKNDKTKNPASEEMNRALAEVTGGDPDRLVLAAYYEKAPEVVKNSLKDSEQYRQFKKLLVNSEFLTEHFKEMGIETATDEMKDEAVVAFVDSISHEEFIEIWHALLKHLLYKDPVEFQKVAKLTSNKPYDLERLYQLEKLRLSKGLTREEVASAMKISNTEYDYLENLGGFTFLEGDLPEKYNKALEYLENYQPQSQIINKEFEAFINNPEHGLFFKELLEAPEQRIKDLQKIWEVIKRASESDS